MKDLWIDDVLHFIKATLLSFWLTEPFLTTGQHQPVTLFHGPSAAAILNGATYSSEEVYTRSLSNQRCSVNLTRLCVVALDAATPQPQSAPLRSSVNFSNRLRLIILSRLRYYPSHVHLFPPHIFLPFQATFHEYGLTASPFSIDLLWLNLYVGGGVNECLLLSQQVFPVIVIRALLRTVRIEYLEFSLSALIWSSITATRPLDAKIALSRIDLLTVWRLNTRSTHRNRKLKSVHNQIR